MVNPILFLAIPVIGVVLMGLIIGVSYVVNYLKTTDFSKSHEEQYNPWWE